MIAAVVFACDVKGCDETITLPKDADLRSYDWATLYRDVHVCPVHKEETFLEWKT